VKRPVLRCLYVRDTHTPTSKSRAEFKERLADMPPYRPATVRGHQESIEELNLDRHEDTNDQPQPWPPRIRWYARTTGKCKPGAPGKTQPTWQKTIRVQDLNREKIPGHHLSDGYGFTPLLPPPPPRAISLGFTAKGESAGGSEKGRTKAVVKEKAIRR